jgi:hypothetical protein
VQQLDTFEPRLVGTALTGSATVHSDIQRHVFSDSPEAVFLHLLDRRCEYEVFERNVKMQADRQVTVPTVLFEMVTEPNRLPYIQEKMLPDRSFADARRETPLT